MLIKKVNLENYGAIKSTQLEFQAGWNLINGANGNGKSHIIRSIAYLLLNKTFGKIDDDCNWDSDTFFAELEAVYQNIDFNIKSKYNRKSGTTKSASIDGNNFETTQETVDALKEYFDPTLCSASILSFQGNMDIVTAKDAERREILKKIYDLNFDEQVQKLKDEKEVLEEERQKLEKEIYVLESKVYNFEEPYPLPMTEQEVKELQLQVKEIENKLVEYSNFEQALAQAEKEVKYFKEVLEGSNREIRNLEETIEQKSKELIEEEENLNDLDVEGQMQDIKDNIAYLEKRTDINTLQAEYDSIELKRIKSFNESALEEKINLLYSKRRDLEDAQNMVSLINQGKCPTCKHEFKDADKEEYVKQITSLNKEVTDLDKEITELKKEKSETEEEMRKQENLKNRKNHLSSQIELQEQTIRNKIENLEQKKNDLFSRKDFYEMGIKKIKEEIEEAKKSLEAKIEYKKECQNNLDTKEKELLELKTQAPEDKEDLEHTRGNILTKIEGYNYTKTQNQIIEENNKKLEVEKKKDSRKLDIARGKCDTVVKDISQYDEAITVYKKELPKYIISYLLEDLKQGMNDLLDEAYNGRYHVEMQETKTGLKILYGDKKKEIALSSGAEQNLFNLGFKNAFSYLSGLQILFLDESLNFADDNIARQTFNHLNLKLEKGDLEQIFVITHKPKIKELLEADYGAKVFTVEDGNVTVGGI